MLFGDYHTHSNYSDGHSSLEENIQYASSIGLKELAITDHSYSSIIFGMSDKKWAEQKEIIAASKGITLLHGVEANIYADGKLDIDGKDLRDIDVLIAGFHRLIGTSKIKHNRKFILINGFFPIKRRKKEIDNNTKIFIKAIETYPIDILAHINFRALVNVKEVCAACKRNNVYVELNVKHLISIKDCVQDMIDSGCNFIVCTDAHRSEEIANVGKVLEFIDKNNIPKDRIYGIDKKPTFKKR